MSPNSSVPRSLRQDGQREDAERALAKLRASQGEGGAVSYSWVYAQWRDRERALDNLEAAMRSRDPWLQFVKTYPLTDPLREEPRFQALMRETEISRLIDGEIPGRLMGGPAAERSSSSVSANGSQATLVCSTLQSEVSLLGSLSKRFKGRSKGRRFELRLISKLTLVVAWTQA